MTAPVKRAAAAIWTRLIPWVPVEKNLPADTYLPSGIESRSKYRIVMFRHADPER